MLQQMRALSQNFVGRAILAVVLGFIILSFAIWGIGDRFTGFNADELATVGATRITVDQYRNAYQDELQQMQQKAKRAITNTEARRLGLDRQVLSRLLSNAILDQEAAKLGLAVGDAEVVRELARDPNLKGADGKLDPERFKMALANAGMSEPMFLREQRATVMRQDVSQAVIGGLEVPNAIRAAIHRYQAEVRDFTFFTLPPSAAGQVPAPTDAELRQYYDERPGVFAAPEYRKLVVLSIVPADLVKPDQVSDADARKRYEEMKDERFVVPEKRTLEQLFFADAGAAKTAREKLDHGTTFADLLKDEKKTQPDAALTAVTAEQVGDKALADAAFALPEGGTSQPVTTQFGTVLLVHASKIVPGHKQAYEEVASQLKNELAIVRAKAKATKLRDTIEDQRAGGKTLGEVASGAGLTTRTIDAIDARGFDKAHKPVEGLVDGPALLKAAFGSDVGADTEILPTADGGDVWYEVAGIDAAHKLPLAEVKPRIEAMWKAEETDRRLAKAADAIVAEIGKGKPLIEAAAAHGNLQVAKAADVSRLGSPELPPGVVSAVFETATGQAGAAASAQGRAVFQVTAARVPPLGPDAELEKIMAQVKDGVVDDVLAQYLSQAQKEIGVKLNERALSTALGSADSGS